MNATKVFGKLKEKIEKIIATPIYKYYEKRLFDHVKRGRMPEHVGIILDGNRRWAMRQGLPVWKGHWIGFQKAKQVLDWCLELGIRNITLYAFSKENFSRNRKEVEELMDVIATAFLEVANHPKIHTKRVRFRAIGNLDLLPEKVREAIRKAEEATKNYRDYNLVVAVGYSGRDEIVNAVKKIVSDAKAGKISEEDITEELIHKYLYTKDLPDPDLIIRTSGEERLSGFLLWQSAYSELYFCQAYWPEFRKIDFLRAIRDYQSRERRFGR